MVIHIRNPRCHLYTQLWLRLYLSLILLFRLQSLLLQSSTSTQLSAAGNKPSSSSFGAGIELPIGTGVLGKASGAAPGQCLSAEQTVQLHTQIRQVYLAALYCIASLLLLLLLLFFDVAVVVVVSHCCQPVSNATSMGYG